MTHAPATGPGALVEPGAPVPSRSRLPALLTAFISGCIMAAGLTLSGMTQPEKVVAFLDVRAAFDGAFPGTWDPALGFVVLGALAVTPLGFALTAYASRRPWFSARFTLTNRRSIDGRLIVGAIVFGIGWGMSGYSPSTALASLLTGQIDTVVFVLAMLPGMWLAGKL